MKILPDHRSITMANSISARISSFSTSKSQENKPPTCFDHQHKPLFHELGPQRYSSPTTGKCRRLKVQSTAPRSAYGEVNVSCNTSRILQTSLWLVTHSPTTPEVLFLWILRYAWFLLLIWYSFYDDADPPVYTGWYKAYSMKFWGQLWAARA